MTIKAKMVAYFLVVVLITAVGSMFTATQVSKAVSLTSDLKTNALPQLLDTDEVWYNSAQMVANLRGYLLSGDKTLITKWQELKARSIQIEKDLISRAKTEEDRRLGNEVKELDEKYCQLIEQRVLPLAQSGQMDAAIQVVFSDVAPVIKALQGKVEEFVRFREALIHDDFNTVMKESQSAKTITILAAGLAGVIGVAIGLFAAFSISAPLVAATDHINLMAKGDFTRDVPGAFMARNDEFGTMAKAFDNMGRNIRALVREVQTNVEHLASSGEELTASADQSAQAAHQVAGSIAEVARGAEGQLAAANNTSAVAEQISASIQQVAASANQIASQSAQAAVQANDGTRSVVKAIDQMAKIEGTVNTSAQVVTKLGQRSKEIGQIVATITDIANQTNLLSLNAAIEAARAGEQGRGFAVVADEVRKLADQSGKATKEIAALISDIQQETDRAVAAMNDGTREVKTGTVVVNTAGEAFRQINELVASVSAQMKEISGTIEQMATGSQQIVTAVREIDGLSRQSSAETQTVSAATEEQLASMEEIAAASQELAKLAQGLQDSVSKFRV